MGFEALPLTCPGGLRIARRRLIILSKEKEGGAVQASVIARWYMAMSAWRISVSVVESALTG